MGNIIDTLKFKKACTYALKEFLGISEEEIVLIISDEELKPIGMTFFESAKKITDQAFYLELKPMKVNGEEVQDIVSESMKMADAVLCITSKSLTYNKAVKEATELGVRIATMPGITPDFILRCINADNPRIIERTMRLADALENISELRLETKAGTNLAMNIEGRNLFRSDGVIRSISKYGNLPSGEIAIPLNHERTNGILIVDGSASMMGKIKEPVKMEIQNGVAAKISGNGGDARIFARFMKKIDDERTHTLSHIGIGTNHNAILSGNIMEDIKAIGSVHVGFGNNINIGGDIDIPSHHNAFIKNAYLYADGKKIVANGRLMID